MFQGAIVAIVTPFKNNKVDFESYEKLIESIVGNGIHGIVPCGTTGESATQSHQEHEEVIRFTVEIVKKRVPVIAGTGSNNTVEAIRLTKHAKEVQCDGVLMVTPYYNKPSQQGMIKHYTKVADELDIPIVLYNIQSRTGINMTSDTIIQLSKHKNIVGVKEASGNLEQVMQIVDGTDKNFTVLSGDDILTVPLCSVGAKGVISVIANVLPKETSEFAQHCIDNNFTKAQEFLYQYMDLMKGMFLETNPVPVKQALSYMGICSEEVRLPLCEMSEENKNKLKTIMKEKKLIP